MHEKSCNTFSGVKKMIVYFDKKWLLCTTKIICEEKN